MTHDIYTYPKPFIGANGREDWANCKLVPWRPGMDMRQSAWYKTPHVSLRRGRKVTIDWSNKWSFGCGSVFNWVDNHVYAPIHPDRTRSDRYILRCGSKHCAGARHPERDIWVDGDYWYYIRNLKILDKKVDDPNVWGGCSTYHKFTFVVDSYPDDVPTLVRQANEQHSRVYMGEWQLGDFKVTISHADPIKRKWLTKALRTEAERALKEIFARAEDKYTLEI